MDGRYRRIGIHCLLEGDSGLLVENRISEHFKPCKRERRECAVKK
jgi:hypothetical protein